LLPPFYEKDFPLAVNQGGIGMVMGHELTHGFDDQGRFFGPDGAPAAGLTAVALAAFKERTGCIKDQFDGYVSQSGLNGNGALTLGENIADVGGVRLSFETLQSVKASSGPSAPVVEGLTDEQLFFVAFGQIWCEIATDEDARLRIQTDPHAPGRFRVIGPLS